VLLVAALACCISTVYEICIVEIARWVLGML
jgi:hypothetical protein